MAAAARGPHPSRRCGAATIQENLDARTALGRGFPERLSIALPQSREHALDMLAGPETVGAMVNTAAGIAETVQIADFHVVEAGAAPRLHAERAEKRLPGSSNSMATISVRPRRGVAQFHRRRWSATPAAAEVDPARRGLFQPHDVSSPLLTGAVSAYSSNQCAAALLESRPWPRRVNQYASLDPDIHSPSGSAMRGQCDTSHKSQ